MSCCFAPLADEIGQADSVIGIADELQAGEACGQVRQLCHAIEMADGVLR